MAINLEDFTSLNDGYAYRQPFDEVYLYNGTGTSSNSSTNIVCCREVAEQIRRQIGGDSVAVRVSNASGIIVLTAGEYENSRAVRTYKKSATAKISCRGLVPIMQKLFGKHKYYGFNWRFDAISGGRGRALVLEPNGRWKD